MVLAGGVPPLLGGALTDILIVGIGISPKLPPPLSRFITPGPVHLITRPTLLHLAPEFASDLGKSEFFSCFIISFYILAGDLTDKSLSYYFI